VTGEKFNLDFMTMLPVFVGKIGTGILQLITLGGLGIWALIDVIMIIVGSFKDKAGLPIKA
jgi:hypothetical protein